MGAIGTSTAFEVESAVSVRGACGQVGHSKRFLGDVLKVESQGNKDDQKGWKGLQGMTAGAGQVKNEPCVTEKNKILNTRGEERRGEERRGEERRGEERRGEERRGEERNNPLHVCVVTLQSSLP
ncbi:hypothetical protein HGM15179_008950 [Zosterops borbonicus]|uniref:Uncharacterized protein n=1 Tax=Zosterops borbonicus TaxID=364589 RepID=A0A8K1LLA3_9PASS|nr:hypothetical protein HGM15179_008950 [Zosterops borbonicus]